MSDPTENDDATSLVRQFGFACREYARINELYNRQGPQWASDAETAQAKMHGAKMALVERLVELERAQNVMQSDVGDLLRALGLSDHARPVSCHAIMQADIKNGIFELREVREELEAELQRTSDALGEGPYSSISEHAAALRRAHDALRQDAERWRAVMASEYVQLYGYAGLRKSARGDGYAHMGFALTTLNPGAEPFAESTADALALLTEYADTMRGVLTARLSDTPHGSGVAPSSERSGTPQQ